MKGRPIRGLVGGFLLGIFVDGDLAGSGVVKLESVLLTILPLALLVVGLGLGLWAPIGRWRLVETRPTRPSVPKTFGEASAPIPPPAAEPPAPPAQPSPAQPSPPTEDTPPI